MSIPFGKLKRINGTVENYSVDSFYKYFTEENISVREDSLTYQQIFNVNKMTVFHESYQRPVIENGDSVIIAGLPVNSPIYSENGIHKVDLECMAYNIINKEIIRSDPVIYPLIIGLITAFAAMYFLALIANGIATGSLFEYSLWELLWIFLVIGAISFVAWGSLYTGYKHVHAKDMVRE